VLHIIEYNDYIIVFPRLLGANGEWGVKRP